MQKMNLNLFLSPYTKTNSKRITEVGVGGKDHRPKCDTWNYKYSRRKQKRKSHFLLLLLHDRSENTLPQPI